MGDSVPWCFYQQEGGYTLTSWSETTTGFTGTLALGPIAGPFGGDITKLLLTVTFETNDRFHFKISDPANARWEVPGVRVPPPATQKAPAPLYTVSVTSAPFGIAVTRASTGHVLINTTLPGLVFTDKYLSVSTQLPLNSSLYGVGEHVKPLLLNTQYYTYTGFSRDRGTPPGGVNLYGSHPIYYRLEPDGSMHGVFLLTSNGIDIVLDPQSLTWRTIGGVLDFYVFLGPRPDDVVSQYTTLIGRPFMPPRWALGFHLCRWGYGSLANTSAVVEAMRANNLPQDVQWNDIDYMQSYLDFTLSLTEYPPGPMKAFVDGLHADGMHYVMITDPGISNVQPAGTYAPYSDGVQYNTFIRTQNLTQFAIGSVWPGETVFPDFFNPNATTWWTEQISTFHNELPFDGLWIDMNEPSSFSHPPCENDPTSPYDLGGLGDLTQKTICLGSQQYISSMWNVHNMFGWSENRATKAALDATLAKRSIVISRSTFPGSGLHGGHWLGDNNADWSDLYYSIPGILDFNMFGVPLVGADVCGFGGTSTTPELCTRWMQAGAFYPFYRNHNAIGKPNQAPYAFGEPYTTYIRSAMNLRYLVIPYIYTLFYRANLNGTTVARALMFEFSREAASTEPIMASLDTQWMLGRSLLVSPVITQGATTVSAYFPMTARWFSLLTGQEQLARGLQTLPAPLSVINVHIRGGSVLPLHPPALTTTAQDSMPYMLLVTPDDHGNASGELYHDDGETFLPAPGAVHCLFHAVAPTSTSGVLTTVNTGLLPAVNQISVVWVCGVTSQPSATVNGQTVQVNWSPETLLMEVTMPALTTDFQLAWQF